MHLQGYSQPARGAKAVSAIGLSRIPRVASETAVRHFKPQEDRSMGKKAIWVMLKAKPGKEADVEAFLKQGATMSQDEPGTTTWYGVKMGPGVYGVFDTFDSEEGRDAHMNGEIAKALMANASDLFLNELKIEKMDILADK
jgi:quinol monooxygenase YgiN